jgi:hypothetical protein
VAGRINSIKNSDDPIENRTRDLPVCTAVLQPTAPKYNNITKYTQVIKVREQPSPAI